jgi:hypothetical protein
MQTQYAQIAQLGTFRRVSPYNLHTVAVGAHVAIFGATNGTADGLAAYRDEPDQPLKVITVTGASLEHFPPFTWMEIIGTVQAVDVIGAVYVRSPGKKPGADLWMRVHHNMCRFIPQTYSYG